MKKIITSILVLFAAIVIHAQDEKPVKEVVGPPVLLAPADLVITDISFVSGQKIKGRYYITVRLTIANQGEQPTGDFKLIAFRHGGTFLFSTIIFYSGEYFNA